jgi:CheY-like chemotaxis protein
MPAEASAAAAPSGEGPLSLLGPGGRRPRLLLAEDFEPVRVVTAAMLTGMGCDVDAVAHGEEAVRAAGMGSFDLIVLDIEMPVMDGIAAARSIRKLGGRTGATPIMALSAFLADAIRQESWRDAFDITLPKPANRAALHAAVKVALDIRPRRTGFAGTAPPLISNEQHAAIQAGLSREVWGDLMEVACRDIADCATRLAGACAAGERGKALVFAQKLKALGRTFAAPALAHAAMQVEECGPDGDWRKLAGQLSDTCAATVAAFRPA